MIPVVKWTGSKRSQADKIVKLFPSNIDTYYEPFCGGCSVLFKLLEFVHTNRIKVNKFICSDLNNDLINLWLTIKDNPKDLYENYTNLQSELLKCKDITEKSAYYINVRNRFNVSRDVGDFYFLNRTSYNGLVRYNSKGEYNTSFHLKRNGADQDKIKETIMYHSNILNKYDVTFICQPYVNIKPKTGDLLYLDPPYEKSASMYFNNFENIEFLDWLSSINCVYFLSYDGKTDKSDKDVTIPNQLYDAHIYLESGLSSFSQLKHNNVMVSESLYIKNMNTSYINKKLNDINRAKKLF